MKIQHWMYSQQRLRSAAPMCMQPLVVTKTMRTWLMTLMLCCQTRGHKKYSQILSSKPITFFIASWCFDVEFLDYWTLNVSRTASYEITIVLLSVRPSLSFLKIGSLVFSDILHDDSWPWYLVTDEARFLKKKKKLAARIWVKIGPQTNFFAIFSSFVHWFFLKSPTKSMVKSMKKLVGERVQKSPFFAISLFYVGTFP